MANNLYFFNPTCELALAHGKSSYCPPAHLSDFERDLEVLPCWLANGDDAILTRGPVAPRFISYLQELRDNTPLFITSTEGLGGARVGNLQPWGWSLPAHAVFKPFKPLLDSSWIEHPMATWHESHRELLSRETGVKICSVVKSILLSTSPTLLEILAVPVKVTSIAALGIQLNNYSAGVLLKTPWSASGRGLYRLLGNRIDYRAVTWIEGKLRQQGFVFVEPYLQKVSDLSFHFRCGADGFSFLGVTWFKTCEKGRFEGCYLLPGEERGVAGSNYRGAIAHAVEVLTIALQSSGLRERYRGPLGIDAMFYLNRNNEVRLHPCIEINLRHTMGLLNIALSRFTHPLSSGFWSIEKITNANWLEKQKAAPTRYLDGMPVAGAVALTPPPGNQGYMAYLNLEMKRENVTFLHET